MGRVNDCRERTCRREFLSRVSATAASGLLLRDAAAFAGSTSTSLPTVAFGPHRISRLGISRSFQITNIFQELSVRQNVEVALTAFHGKALAMLRLASRDREIIDEAYGLLERLGLEALAEQRAGVLSYGDKRLLEIAIVLATRPHLVLLDEPTAGMTPEETRHVTHLIRKLADSGDYTFLVTEHDMSVVFGLADRILVMHRGQRLAEGTPEEIRNDPEVKRAYLGEEEEEAAS